MSDQVKIILKMMYVLGGMASSAEYAGWDYKPSQDDLQIMRDYLNELERMGDDHGKAN